MFNWKAPFELDEGAFLCAFMENGKSIASITIVAGIRANPIFTMEPKTRMAVD
jgi:hypothetical protein